MLGAREARFVRWATAQGPGCYRPGYFTERAQRSQRSFFGFASRLADLPPAIFFTPTGTRRLVPYSALPRF